MLTRRRRMTTRAMMVTHLFTLLYGFSIDMQHSHVTFHGPSPPALLAQRRGMSAVFQNCMIPR